MQHLIVFTISFILSILVAYSRNYSELMIVLLWMGMFIIPVYRENKRLTLSIITGFIIGMILCSFYNSEILLEKYSLNNKKYVKLKYVRNIGQSEIYFSGNKLFASEGKWTEIKKEPGGIYFAPYDLTHDYYNLKGVVFNLNQTPILTSNSSLRWKIEEFKLTLSKKLKESSGNEEGALISSLILGIKDDVLKDKNDTLKSLGIIHILSISGFHVNLLESLLKKIKLKKTSTFIIIGYAVMVNSVPAYRACLMKMSSVFAKANRKDSSAIGDLVISALILLSLKPYLLFDLSFQLTYCATLGMILFNEFINMRMADIRNLKPWIKNGISGSISALFLSLPFIALINDTISLSLIPANLLIVPVYTGICITSLLTILTLELSFLNRVLLIIFKSLNRLSGIIEGLVLFLFNFKLDINSVVLIYFYLTAVVFCKVYSKASSLRKFYYFLTIIFFLFIVFNPPFVTRIRYTKNYGLAKVEISGFLKRGTFVNETMYKPGRRDDLTCVEENISFCNLDLEKTKNDFINVTDQDFNLSKPVNMGKSDIIDIEYIKVGNRLFKVR